MAANIGNFAPNNPYDSGQALVNLLPTGTAYEAVNIDDSNVRKLLRAISKEFSRLEAEVYAFASQFIPSKNMRFVEDWERFLGIPDNCIPILDSYAARAANVFLKFGFLNFFTEADYFTAAEILGIEIITFERPSFGTINIYITGGSIENKFTAPPPEGAITFTAHGLPNPIGAFQFGSPQAGIFACIAKTYSPAWCLVNVYDS